jgi:type I restriction enzyme S subunit
MIQNWNYIRFGDLFDYENKSKIKAGDGLASGSYPFYTSSVELTKFIDQFQFDKTSLIFGTGGNASIHYCDNPFSVSTDCLVAIAKDETKVYPKYVFYYLFGNINLLEEGFKGAGLKHISKGYINEIQIPLPPLATQKRIAEILDAADALRRKDQELVKKYDELAQAIFIDMFGDPLKNDKGWDVKKIQDVCKQIFGGGTPSKSKPDYYLGTIPWVTPKDMKSDIISDSIDHINEDAVKNSSTKLVPKNSVLMVIRSGILKHTLPVAINDKIVSMNQDMKAFIPNTDLTNSIFLKYFFHRVASFLLTKVRAVTADNIEFEQIKNMLFICPPIDLQNDFSVRISNIQKQLETNLDLSKKTESLYNTLIQKAFNGELVS